MPILTDKDFEPGAGESSIASLTDADFADQGALTDADFQDAPAASTTTVETPTPPSGLPLEASTHPGDVAFMERIKADAAEKVAKEGALKAAGREAAFSAAPSLAGIGAGVMTGAATGAGLGALGLNPVTVGVGGIAGGLIGGIGAAVGADWLQGKALSAVAPEQAAKWQAEREAAASLHPVASMAGSLAPQLIAMKPSLKNVATAGKAAKMLLSGKFTEEVVASPAGKQMIDQMFNVGIGAAVPGAQEAYAQYQAGDFNAARLAAQIIGGAIINEPNKFGVKMGMHPSAGNEPAEKVQMAPTPRPPVGDSPESSQARQWKPENSAIYADDVERLNAIHAAGGNPPVTVSERTAWTPEIEAADRMAERVGIRMVVVDGLTAQNGATLADDPSVIFISSKSEQPALTVAAHEIKHTMDAAHPDLGEKLDNVLADHIAERGEHPGETHADAFAEALSNPMFWQRLAREDMTLFQRLYEVVQKVIATVANAIPEQYRVNLKSKDSFFKVQEAAMSAYKEMAGRAADPNYKPSWKAEPFSMTAAEVKARQAEGVVKGPVRPAEIVPATRQNAPQGVIPESAREGATLGRARLPESIATAPRLQQALFDAQGRPIIESPLPDAVSRVASPAAESSTAPLSARGEGLTLPPEPVPINKQARPDTLTGDRGKGGDLFPEAKSEPPKLRRLRTQLDAAQKKVDELSNDDRIMSDDPKLTLAEAKAERLRRLVTKEEAKIAGVAKPVAKVEPPVVEVATKPITGAGKPAKAAPAITTAQAVEQGKPIKVPTGTLKVRVTYADGKTASALTRNIGDLSNVGPAGHIGKIVKVEPLQGGDKPVKGEITVKPDKGGVKYSERKSDEDRKMMTLDFGKEANDFIKSMRSQGNHTATDIFDHMIDDRSHGNEVMSEIAGKVWKEQFTVTPRDLPSALNKDDVTIKKFVTEVMRRVDVEEAIERSADIKYSTRKPASVVTPEQDRSYLDAVGRGDTAEAQRMVDDAAKAAGTSMDIRDMQQRGYKFLSRSGRQRGERDVGGELVHIVAPDSPRDYGAALDGVKPGQKGNGWATWESEVPTCPDCIRIASAPSGVLSSKNGKPITVWHGSKSREAFTTFSTQKIDELNNYRGFYFATDKRYAFGMSGSDEQTRLFYLVADRHNGFISKGNFSGDLTRRLVGSGLATEENVTSAYRSVVAKLKELGLSRLPRNDDVLAEVAERKGFNEYDVIPKLGYEYVALNDGSTSLDDATEIVVFSPSQIKSADPITRDDQGRVIPLSERFNEASADIRYSTRKPSLESPSPASASAESKVNAGRDAEAKLFKRDWSWQKLRDSVGMHFVNWEAPHDTRIGRNEQGRAVMNLFKATRGSSGKAGERIDTVTAAMNKAGMKHQADIDLLNLVREAKRTIEVDEVFRKRTAADYQAIRNDPNWTAKDEAEYTKELESFKSRMTVDEANAVLADAKKNKNWQAVEKADALVQAEFDKNLDMLHENGIVSDDSYAYLKANHKSYQPRIFLDKIDPARVMDNGRGGKVSVHDSGIRSLDHGSEGHMVSDTMYLLGSTTQRTESIIAKNKANIAMAKLIADNPPDLKMGDYKPMSKWDDAPPAGYEPVFYMDGGKRKAFAIKQDIAGNWRLSDPAVQSGLAKFLSHISGTSTVKFLATAGNPEFAVANIFRDIGYNWFSGKQYSPFLPIAVAQTARNIGQQSISKSVRNILRSKYVEHGGSMEFLSTAGHLSDLHSPGAVTNGRRAVNKVLKVMGFIGTKSEEANRLAHMNQTLRNMGHDVGGSAGWEARIPNADWAKAAAESSNVLDFRQGGNWVKALDSVVPFIGASAQGARGVARSFKDRPVETSFKAAQLIAIGAYMAWWNRKNNENAWESISEGDKNTRLNISIPGSKRDVNGNERFGYVGVPIDQGWRPFMVIGEMMADKQAGKPVDVARLRKVISANMMPAEVSNLPPLIKALLTYSQNHDFWSNEDVWKGRKVEPSAERLVSTPETFNKIGDVTGASPERLRVAAKAIIPDNPWAYAGNKSVDFFGNADKPKEDDLIRLSQSPFARKILRFTSSRQLTEDYKSKAKLLKVPVSGRPPAAILNDLAQKEKAVNTIKQKNDLQFDTLANNLKSKQIVRADVMRAIYKIKDEKGRPDIKEMKRIRNRLHTRYPELHFPSGGQD